MPALHFREALSGFLGAGFSHKSVVKILPDFSVPFQVNYGCFFAPFVINHVGYACHAVNLEGQNSVFKQQTAKNGIICEP